jgi:hypothetical protein
MFRTVDYARFAHCYTQKTPNNNDKIKNKKNMQEIFSETTWHKLDQIWLRWFV